MRATEVGQSPVPLWEIRAEEGEEEEVREGSYTRLFTYLRDDRADEASSLRQRNVIVHQREGFGTRRTQKLVSKVTRSSCGPMYESECDGPSHEYETT